VSQLNTAISWFIWKGDIFRAPLSTLHRPKEEGGWGLIHPLAKCQALILYRMRHQSQKTNSLPADWLRTCGLKEQGANPPFRDRIPARLDYLRRFVVDSAYNPPLGPTESKRAYKRRVYNTLHHISIMVSGLQELRITKLWPHTDWNTVWTSIHCAPVPGGTKAAWFKVVHDILPTNVRLHNIRISPTHKCSHCGRLDTVLHRLTECGEGPEI
jgi:hypothetical protein